jgi:hypothetical protein
MLKKIIVTGLATIVIGATGAGVYSAWQNGDLVSHTPRVQAAADGSGYRGGQGATESRGGGQDGAQLEQGSQGNRGSQGATGSLGAGQDGAQLEQGSQGYQGGQGAAGSRGGSQGSAQLEQGSQGYRGGQGATTPQGSAGANGVPQTQAGVEEWLTLTGVVSGVDQTSLTLTTGDGQTLTLELGQPRFWTSQGVELQTGDAIEVLGFEADEGDGLVFQATTITRLSDGATVQLRDADGRPLWSGRGRG